MLALSQPKVGQAVPNKFHSLVVSRDDDFREELVERAVGLNFSVRAIGLPDELPRLLPRYRFAWLILDLALGEGRCLEVMERLAAESPPPRAILIAGKDRAVVDSVRTAATHNGMDVVGVLDRPLSFPQWKALRE